MLVSRYKVWIIFLLHLLSATNNYSSVTIIYKLEIITKKTAASHGIGF
jgi:hypothetical protein